MAYFIEETQIRKPLALTMITMYGILPDIHSGIVNNEIVMDGDKYVIRWWNL